MGAEHRPPKEMPEESPHIAFREQPEWIYFPRQGYRSHNPWPWYAPAGRRPMIILYTAALCFFVCFYPAYASSYTNTAEEYFRAFINNSYVLRGHPHGLTPSENTWIWSLILNAVWLGNLLPAMVCPLFCDRWGRRPTLIFGSVGVLVSNLLESTAVLFHSPEGLFIGRVLGFSSQMFNFSAMILIIMESTPTELRGLCLFISGTVYTGLMGIGTAAGMHALLGWSLPLLIGFAVIPNSIALLLSILTPESPKFLLLIRGDKPAALASIRFYQGGSVSAEEVLDEARKEEGKDGDGPTGYFSMLRELVSHRHLRRAMLLGLATLQMTLGIWPITTQLLLAHFPDAQAELYSLLLFCENFAAGLLGVFIVQRLPRRRLIIGSALLSALSICAYIAFDRMALVWRMPFASYGCLAAFAVYYFAFGVGFGSIAYYITSELLPQRYRSLGQSSVFFMFLISAFAFSFITLPIYEAYDVWVFIPFFIIPDFICVAYLYSYLPETRNREIHEIVEELKAVRGRGELKKRVCGDRIQPVK